MFPLEGESVCLSSIIVFYSREILSYAVGTNAKMDKIKSMLIEPKENHDENIEGMILQSDQGVQYQNSRYNEILINLGIIQSMSRKGNCLDNSPTENFFGRMKTEMWYGHEKDYRDSKVKRIIKDSLQLEYGLIIPFLQLIKAGTVRHFT